MRTAVPESPNRPTFAQTSGTTMQSSMATSSDLDPQRLVLCVRGLPRGATELEVQRLALDFRIVDKPIIVSASSQRATAPALTSPFSPSAAGSSSLAPPSFANVASGPLPVSVAPFTQHHAHAPHLQHSHPSASHAPPSALPSAVTSTSAAASTPPPSSPSASSAAAPASPSASAVPFAYAPRAHGTDGRDGRDRDRRREGGAGYGYGYGGYGYGYGRGRGMGPQGPGAGQHQRRFRPRDDDGDDKQQPNSILLVTLHDARQPVRMEHVHQLFSQCGQVLKIVLFVKNSLVRALVQMASVDQAVVAKQTLDHRPLLPGGSGGGDVRIRFSTLPELTVKADGPRSRDFTLPPSASASASASSAPVLFPPSHAHMHPHAMHPHALAGMQMEQYLPSAFRGPSYLGELAGESELDQQQPGLGALDFLSGQQQQQQRKSAGLHDGSGLFTAEHASAEESAQQQQQQQYYRQGLMSMSAAAAAAATMGALAQSHSPHAHTHAQQLHPHAQLGPMGMMVGLPMMMQHPAHAAAAGLPAHAHAHPHAHGPAGPGPVAMMHPGAAGMRSSVLLVSNLNDARVSPDVLFTLFGVYGDVLRVKIFYNKKDTALIQFANPQQAFTAQLHLNHLELFGKPMSITPSHKPQVTMPHPTVVAQAQGAMLTRDYTRSSLHRFRNRFSKNYRHICPPSAVLHVSNVPESASARDLQELFGADKVLSVNFFKNNRRMAFVRFTSLPIAVEALVRFHNHPLLGSHLRISFSHKTAEQIMSEADTEQEETKDETGAVSTPASVSTGASATGGGQADPVIPAALSAAGSVSSISSSGASSSSPASSLPSPATTPAPSLSPPPASASAVAASASALASTAAPPAAASEPARAPAPSATAPASQH